MKSLTWPLSYLGCVGILGGINAAGVADHRLSARQAIFGGDASPAIILGAGDSFRSTGGVAASTLVRTVLGSATNLQQAIELAQSLTVAGGQAWVALVTQRRAAGQAVAIEFDGRELRVQSATDRWGNLGLPPAKLPCRSTDAATLAAASGHRDRRWARRR